MAQGGGGLFLMTEVTLYEIVFTARIPARFAGVVTTSLSASSSLLLSSLELSDTQVYEP